METFVASACTTSPVASLKSFLRLVQTQSSTLNAAIDSFLQYYIAKHNELIELVANSTDASGDANETVRTLAANMFIEVSNMMSAVTTYSIATRALTERMTTAESHITASKTLMDTLGAASSSAETRLETLTADVDTCKTSIGDLYEKYNAQRGVNISLQSGIETSLANSNTNASSLATLTGQVTALNDSLKALQKTVSGLNITVATHTDSLKGLALGASETGSAVAALQLVLGKKSL